MSTCERHSLNINCRLTRGEFLKIAGLALLGSTLSSSERGHFEEEKDQEPLKLSPSELGINLRIRGIKYFGLDIEETLKTFLNLNIQHVRIPIHFDDVFKEGQWKIGTQVPLIERVLRAGKTLHLQIGLLNRSGGQRCIFRPRLPNSIPTCVILG